MYAHVAVRALSSIAVVLAFAPGSRPQREQQTTIAVRGSDFALEMPDSIRAGTHVWTFRNDGQSRHEFLLARLQPGADVKAVVDSLHALGLRAFFSKESVALVGGGLFAAPGMLADAGVVTHDRSGDVLLAFCQLREAPDKPKHDAMGMFKIVRVK